MNSIFDDNLIKKPYRKERYTEYQIQEFAKCADPVFGPFYWMSNYFYVQHPTKGKLLYHPFTYQIRLIDSYHNYNRTCAMIPRQAGKSVTAAGYLLWYAMFNKDKDILIAAHVFSGASEIMVRVRFGYENCPDFIRAGVTGYNKQSIVFENGSRIAAVTTTENTARGKSLSLLYIDELSAAASRLGSERINEFWSSCSLTLSTGGKVIITSTPNKPDDLFADIWHGSTNDQDDLGNTIKGHIGRNGFHPVTAHWSEHPDRDEKWAEEQRKLVGDELFAREIQLKFISFEETLINAFTLNQLQGIEPIENEGQIRWYCKPKKGNIYFVSLDPSIGTGGDPSAIQVFEAKTKKQVAEWTHNKTPIEKQINILKEITTKLSEITEDPTKIYWSIENNTIGEATLVAIRNIGEESIPGIFLSESVKLGNIRKFRKGFNTTNSSKLAACAKLKEWVEGNHLHLYSKKLIHELRNFISRENTYKAKSGETDDLVLALILIVRMMEQLKTYIPDLDNDDKNEESIPLPFIMDSSNFIGII